MALIDKESLKIHGLALSDDSSSDNDELNENCDVLKIQPIPYDQLKQKLVHKTADGNFEPVIKDSEMNFTAFKQQFGENRNVKMQERSNNMQASTANNPFTNSSNVGRREPYSPIFDYHVDSRSIFNQKPDPLDAWPKQAHVTIHNTFTDLSQNKGASTSFGTGRLVDLSETSKPPSSSFDYRVKPGPNSAITNSKGTCQEVNLPSTSSSYRAVRSTFTDLSHNEGAEASGASASFGTGMLVDLSETSHVIKSPSTSSSYRALPALSSAQSISVYDLEHLTPESRPIPTISESVSPSSNNDSTPVFNNRHEQEEQGCISCCLNMCNVL